MSLLMQALKKAERAKQNANPDSETDKPSEEFDAVLHLTPEAAMPEPAPSPVPPYVGSDLSFALEPMDLEPMAPRPSPSPLPAASDHRDAGLTLDLAPDPADPVPAGKAAKELAPLEMQSPAAHRSAAPQPAPFTTDASAAAAAAAARSPAPARNATAPQAHYLGDAPAPPLASAAAPAAARSAAPAPSAAKAAAGKSDSAAKPRGAARARAAAAATTAEPAGMDPERLRLIGLIALLVLIVAGFGWYYWQAIAAPGAGSRLPPVPMPPPGATGVTMVSPGSAGVGNGVIAPPPSDDAMLAPPINRASGNRDNLEQRLARTEEQLAAAQQAIQNQLLAPRAETLPPVAAQDSGDIRVARATKPSRLSPVLEGAYQALNSGDLTNAQQQYEAALRDDANNRDALLGLAALAARQNQGAQASSYYLRLLELDPNDNDAVAGLIGLRNGDVGQNENRLKGILGANPEAGPVLFALGNLYARQGRWPEAQQTYFRAVGAAPDNPDYAYNLAIGLDHLNQPKLAVEYYQRALALAQNSAAAFDKTALRKRLHELTTAAH